VTFALFFLLVGRVWLKEFESVTTFLGIVSAGLAIAMKDPLVNVAGWLFILWRHPFKVGDRIQIGVHAGDVIEISIFQFTIMEIGNWVHADQRTGRIVHIRGLESNGTKTYAKESRPALVADLMA
jgi:small-conductance mechanosensitive channel